MLLEIPHVLDAGTLLAVNRLIDGSPFVDGRHSAGRAAAPVKRNEEIAPDADVVARLNELVVGALYRNAVFRNAVLPHRIAGAFYARYTAGMRYGPHTDDPVMGGEQRYRADVAVTVFLSDPDAYQGGELCVQTPFGEQTVKLPAGHAVAYPASSLHRVDEVRAGERRVAVTWVQSLVRDAERRALLYELDVARQALQRVTPEAEVTARVDRAYTNLVRMWADV